MPHGTILLLLPIGVLRFVKIVVKPPGAIGGHRDTELSHVSCAVADTLEQTGKAECEEFIRERRCFERVAVSALDHSAEEAGAARGADGCGDKCVLEAHAFFGQAI